MKIILISHFNLATGMKETLKYFNESAEDIIAINAYMDDIDPIRELELALLSVSGTVLIFTDILGGSVNQYAIKHLGRANTYVFCGMNLGMVLQAMALGDGADKEQIISLENAGKESVVCMNTYDFPQFDEEDE
ncbi:MAG: PTS sugar transporter subunit IIA [Anaerorhabdus sp.]